MKKRISLLLPTRGRPDLVQRFLRSVAEQSAHPELVEVVLCVDEDDVGSHGIAFDQLALKLIVGPRRTMGEYNAECLRLSSGEITIAVNDDIVVRTKGWDDMVRTLDAHYADGVYLGYGNDLFKGPRLCTFPILSRTTCDLMIEPYPPDYKGAFIDMHLMDIFRRLEHRGYARICYAADLVFEHVHYRNNPAALDATYSDRLRFADDLTFISLIEARRLEADRLAAHIAGGTPVTVPYPRSVVVEPIGIFGIVRLCFRKFLCDDDLPLGSRTRLFVWMLARHYFSRLYGVP
jgi:hypothetical protein